MAQAAPIVSTAFKVGSSLMEGRSRAGQYVTEAAQAERQAKDIDLQALQSSELSRERLRANLSGLQAQFSQQGRSLDSPTAVAIEKEIGRQSVRDEGVERLGFINQASAYRTSATARRRAARGALLSSYMQAGSSIMSGYSDWKGSQPKKGG